MDFDRDAIALRFAVALMADQNLTRPAAAAEFAYKMADAFWHKMQEENADAATAPVNAPVEALRFDSNGFVVEPEKHGPGILWGEALDSHAAACVRAESRAHAKRIVSAMLAAGRAVKP